MLKSFLTLHHILKNHIRFIYFSCGELVIEVEHTQINWVLSFLKDHEPCFYKLLVDIIIIDQPEKLARFTVIYSLLSIKFNCRLKVTTSIHEIESLISITNLYKNASWLEREVFDLFGIYFENHPDLRRILTDYGFAGYPLRKDFPLSGFKEVRYDDSQKRVVYEHLELTQEFRLFNFSNPWGNLNKAFLV
jgi:NADH/F420H2 dehydrogenase subunit C